MCQKQDANVRIAQLEEKLDGLIERLESRPTPDVGFERELQTEPSAQAVNSESADPSHDAVAPESEPQDSGDVDMSADTDSGALPWSPSVVGSTPVAFTEWNYPSDAETERLLSMFRSRMLQHFPFVHLPAELTAEQLQRERPFLLSAILCVASQKSRDTEGSKLKRAICEALLLGEGADRIDLLLGLLTYISWAWDHSKVLSRLMMQAVPLACEICDRGPRDAPMRTLFTPTADTDAVLSRSHFLEQQRAVLGCFVLSSAVSDYFNHIDAMRWTSQMDEGLAALGANHECPTDAAFTVQVRLQLLGQKSARIRQQKLMEQGYMQAPAETTFMTALVSLMTLQEELQGLKTSLSVSRTSHHLAHISATELVLNESRHAVNAMEPVIISHFSAMTASSSSTGSRGPAKVAERSACLWQCVNAAKACADALLGLSDSEFAGISFVQWAQLVRSVAVLDRLSTEIEDPSWDRAAVHTVVDLPVLLDRVAEKLELAARMLGEHESQGALSRVACRVREACSTWKARADRENRASEDMNARSRVYGGARAGDIASLSVHTFVHT